MAEYGILPSLDVAELRDAEVALHLIKSYSEAP